MKKLVVILLMSLFFRYGNSQKVDIGIYYGRFYSPYKYADFGTGFRNQSVSNYNFFPSVSVSKYLTKKISVEAEVAFTLYEQYYSTRKYILAFESSYGAGQLAVKVGYSFLKTEKLEARIKAGIGIGVMPEIYEAEYVEMMVYPVVDSITRGTIKRNFTPVFPTVTTGFDLSYKIAKRFRAGIAFTYQKGFTKISAYDIYYNDGSGKNDQRAKQYGYGDFYAMQLGLRYAIKDEKGSRFRIKK